MESKYKFFLFFIYTFNLNAQINAFAEEVEFPNCASCEIVKTSSLSSLNSLEYKMLDDLLATIGSSKGFILQECSGAKNAFATEINNKRYILYNKDFFNSIINEQGAYSWSNVSILAHEIGHHINGHVLDCESTVLREEKRKMELEADFFMGTAMHRLGASYQQATMAINTLIPFEKDDSGSTHPSKSKRLKAIKEGYNDKGTKKYMSNLAEENLYKAIDYYNNKSYLLANQYLSAVIIFGRKDEIVYEYLAKLNYKIENYEDALTYINNAISYNNNSSELYFQRALIKKELDPYGDKTAISDLDKAIELNPKDPKLYLARAIQGVFFEGFFDLIKYYNKAIELDPNYFEAYYEKAKFIYSSYLYLGKDLFSKGFELHGKMSAVEYLNIGLKAISKAIVINIKEREKEPLTDPEALATNSSNKLADAYITRAQLYQWINYYEEDSFNNDKIVSDYIKAVEEDKNNYYAFNELAKIKFSQKQYKDAEKYFVRYFEIINDQFFCTDSEEDCLSFNVVRWESNEKWSEIVDEFIYSCLLLSDIYFKDKNTDSALEILNRGISLEPSWSEDLFYLRGLIKSLLGDNYGALSDFKRVNELISSANKSSLLEYYKSLQDEKGIQEVFDNYNFIQVLGGAVGRSGILKKEMGDYEGAINDLKESVKTYPLLGITSAEIELEGYKPKSYLLEIADIQTQVFSNYKEAIKTIENGIDFLFNNEKTSISNEEKEYFLYSAYYKLAENNHLYIKDKMEKRLLSEEIGMEENFNDLLVYINKSIEILEKNINNPDFLITHRNLGNSYYLKSEIYFSQFRATDNFDYIDLSHESINKAIEYVKDNPDFYFHRHRTKILTGDGNRDSGYNFSAMLDLQRAFESDKTNTSALFQMAIMKVGQDNKGALTDFTRAIEIEKISKNYYHRGRLKYRMEDYKGAIEDYDKSVEIDIDNSQDWRDGEKAWLYEDKALALLKLGEYHEAIHNYYLALEYIKAYEDFGKDRMYREEIYPNISTKSGIALIINQMGEIKYLLKDFQGSLKDFQKAVKLNPNYARYNYNLGVVLVENPVNMDYEDACKYLVKAKKQGFDLDEKDLITPNGFNYCK